MAKQVANRSPRLIAVAGLPGSGKSFFAGRLATRLGAEYISSDIVRREISAERDYSRAGKQAIYRAMMRQADAHLALGRIVVIDATFSMQSARALLARAAAEHSENPVIFHIVAEPELIRRRLERSRPFSEADYAVYDKLCREFEEFEEEHCVVHSGDDNIDSMLDRALAYLAEQH